MFTSAARTAGCALFMYMCASACALFAASDRFAFSVGAINAASIIVITIRVMLVIIVAVLVRLVALITVDEMGTGQEATPHVKPA